MIVTAIPGALLEPRIGAANAGLLSLAITLVTLPLVALLVAGLIGDKAASLKSVFKHGWLTSLRIIIFAAAVWAPLQWLHSQNHEWAMGQPLAIVWGLMTLDALTVGVLALLAGTAIHHGYTLARQES